MDVRGLCTGKNREVHGLGEVHRASFVILGDAKSSTGDASSCPRSCIRISPPSLAFAMPAGYCVVLLGAWVTNLTPSGADGDGILRGDNRISPTPPIFLGACVISPSPSRAWCPFNLEQIPFSLGAKSFFIRFIASLDINLGVLTVEASEMWWPNAGDRQLCSLFMEQGEN